MYVCTYQVAVAQLVQSRRTYYVPTMYLLCYYVLTMLLCTYQVAVAQLVQRGRTYYVLYLLCTYYVTMLLCTYQVAVPQLVQSGDASGAEEQPARPKLVQRPVRLPVRWNIVSKVHLPVRWYIVRPTYRYVGTWYGPPTGTLEHS